MYGHGSFGLFGVVTKKSISFVETGYEADNISKSLTLSEVEPFNLLFKCWEYCKAFSFDLCTAIVCSWSNLSPSEFPFKTVFDLLFVISVLLFRWYHAVQLDGWTILYSSPITEAIWKGAIPSCWEVGGKGEYV